MSPKMSPKVLVTGATGLIGGQLSRELVETGYEVRTLSTSRALECGQTQHLIADITSPAAQALANGVDAIVHLSRAFGCLGLPGPTVGLYQSERGWYAGDVGSGEDQ